MLQSWSKYTLKNGLSRIHKPPHQNTIYFFYSFLVFLLISGFLTHFSFSHSFLVFSLISGLHYIIYFTIYNTILNINYRVYLIKKIDYINLRRDTILFKKRHYLNLRVYIKYTRPTSRCSIFKLNKKYIYFLNL